jgi:hypothetical protein
MMSAAECLAKAHYALTCAESAADPHLKLHWEFMAKEWSALAASAEGQIILQRALLDRDPTDTR